MISDQDGNPVEKWNWAKGALTAVCDKYEKELDFGLALFPTDLDMPQCGITESLKSDTLESNAGPIVDVLEETLPEGNTPLYDALAQFTDPVVAPLFKDENAPSYLVLLSDGQDTCGMNGNMMDPVEPADLAAITSELLDDHGIQTYVIGIGEGIDPAQLEAIAVSGGTELDDYLPALNQKDIEDAFEEILSL